MPVKLTAEEEIIQKKKQYQSLLNVNGEQLPDPFTELKDNWICEETGVEKWPPILQMQISEFILTAEQGSDLGKRLLSDYKEGKAFSYFDSQWLKEVFYHPISRTLLLEVAINTFAKNRQRTTQDLGLREKDKWHTGGRLLHMFCRVRD